MSDLLWLPQGVAYTFRAGPFISLTDAKTRVTNAVINQADRRLSKAGGAFAQSATEGALAHEANGYYVCTLAAADTDTLGALELEIDVSGCFVVRHKFMVIALEAYNAFMNTGNGLRANMMAVNSINSAAIRMSIAAGEMYPFTVDSTAFQPTATEFEVGDLNVPGADHFKDRSIIWTSGALKGQGCDITGYSVVGGRGHFTVTQLNAAPTNGMTGIII